MSLRKALITGGTGFLGRQIAAVLDSEYEVILASSGRVADRLDTETRDDQFTTLKMDVTDAEAVRNVFRSVKPHIVIHAAAEKHVDRGEKDALRCIDVNVLGSQNIARSAMEFETDAVIAISSSRAAPPTKDTYGLSKATMERMFCSLSGKTNTKFVTVRLGNIAWSTGSVLPVWKNMLDESSVIQTTSPDSCKFIVSVDEAVESVVESLNNVDEFQGKVVVRKAKQAQIKDVLVKFVEINGGSWNRVDSRIGDQQEELLVGDLELPYCSEVVLNNTTHYVLCFNDRANSALEEVVSTKSAEKLTEIEISELIQNDPSGMKRVEEAV